MIALQYDMCSSKCMLLLLFFYLILSVCVYIHFSLCETPAEFYSLLVTSLFSDMERYDDIISQMCISGAPSPVLFVCSQHYLGFLLHKMYVKKKINLD